LQRLFSIGVSKENTLADSRKVKFSNMIAVLGLIFSPFYILLTLFKGTDVVMFTDFLSMAVLALPLAANGLGRHNFARLWICIMYPLLIVKTCYLIGSSMDVDLILIVLGALPLVLFDSPRKYIPLIIYCIAIWVICNTVIPYFEPMVPVYEPGILYLNKILVFIATLLLFWQFKYQVSQFSTQLLNSNNKLQAQNKKVKSSEQRFKTMAENIPNGSISILGPDYTILDAAGSDVRNNPELVRQQLGKNLREVLGKEEFNKRSQYYTRAFSGETAIFESDYLGEYYINSVSPIIVEGQTDAVIVSSQKITEIKKAQQELDSQKMLVQSIFENAPMLISVLSSDGHYLTVNRKYEEQFGLPTADIIGMHYSELLTSNIKELDVIGQNIKKTIEEGRLSYTYVLTSPLTGEEISLYTIYTRLKLDDKDVVMIMAMNISAQKKAEKELSESYRQLNYRNSIINDSIAYARRIQRGVLDSSREFLKCDKNTFALFKPKDILSGDFFWAANLGKLKLIIAADATGHGVPGAMLTLIGTDYLNEIIYSYQIHKPDILLQELDRKLTDMLTKGSSERIQDGMDLAVVLIDPEKKEIEYAAAKSPVFLVSKASGAIKKYKGNSYSIGGFRNMNRKMFTSEIIPFESGDMIYLGSDGFSDQFGGPERKKLGKSRLASILQEVSEAEPDEQCRQLDEKFVNWKGGEEQLDDVLLIGARL